MEFCHLPKLRTIRNNSVASSDSSWPTYWGSQWRNTDLRTDIGKKRSLYYKKYNIPF